MSYMSGVIDKIYVLRWQDPAVTDIPKVVAEVKAANQKAGQKIAYVAIADGASTPPDDEARSAIMHSFDDLREHCHSIILVLEGRGFRHVLMRSIATGVFLARGSRSTHNVDSVDAALTVLGLSDAERQRFLDQARERNIILS